MESEHLILAKDYCALHSVEMSFLDSLSEAGFIQMQVIGNNLFIEHEQLPSLEKWIRLHYEMDINMQGLEAIRHLLDQISSMQVEMRMLRNRLEIYERSGPDF